MIRGEEKAFEHCCPISHSYCEWLSVKLMVWGRLAVVKQDADVVAGHPGIGSSHFLHAALVHAHAHTDELETDEAK